MIKPKGVNPMKETKKRFEIKKLFSTPKKAVMTISVSALAIAILGTTSIFSAYAIAENAAIGEKSAKENAFAAAGIDAEKVDAVKTKFKFHGGKFVYDVEFYSEGKEYEYKIHSKNGKVVGFEKPENVLLPENAITVEEAKEIALTHAGVIAEDATFTKAKLDKEDGIFEYELKFRTESKKYEYEINAENGKILESKSKNTSIFTSEEEKNVISVEEAKKIAVNHSGLTEENIKFKKIKLDKEDGIFVYEIKFFTTDKEFEYEINAESGEIIEFSSDDIKNNGFKDEEKPNNHEGNQNGNANGNSNGNQHQKPDFIPDEGKENGNEMNPEFPNNPEHPEHPENPGNPECPNPERPENPENPECPNPERPENPENPECPNPERPENPENPERPNPERPENPENPERPEAPGNQGNAGQKPNTDKGPHFELFIGIEKAKEAVLEKAGLTAENVIFTKAKLEKEKGKAEYEIEFTCNGKEYECSVNAFTGEIVEFEVE